MFTTDQLQAFKAKIDSAQTIALFGHANIDGDAIGSVLWLAGVLEKLWKTVSCFTTLAPSKYFAFVEWVEKIQTEFNYWQYDLIWFLDFTGYGRIKSFTEWHEEYFDAANIFVVDHHIDDPWFLTEHALKLKDVDASSNCELLLEICNELWPELIDAPIATHWYMGLLTDTWMFQFQKDTVRTLWHAMTLATYGADKDNLVKNLFNSSPKWLIDFMKLVTPRITFTWHICSIWYTLDEAISLWLDGDQAEALMIFIRWIYGVWVYAEFKVENECVRCSLRSGYTDTGRINVQLIAKEFNWWWHMYAAWCAVLRDPQLAIEEQISIITGQINSEAEKQISA
jgi:bifunctional oligoribonuclease and PAP phosphatase NrnA